MIKLKDYLMRTRRVGEDAYERYARFGRDVGVSMYAVRKWLYGERRMSDKMKIKIEKATGGKITVADLVRG